MALRFASQAYLTIDGFPLWPVASPASPPPQPPPPFIAVQPLAASEPGAPHGLPPPHESDITSQPSVTSPAVGPGDVVSTTVTEEPGKRVTVTTITHPDGTTTVTTTEEVTVIKPYYRDNYCRECISCLFCCRNERYYYDPGTNS
jgi:hypothetical protein